MVMEKPFGVDLASARELNERVHAVFDEEQKFRIDHYLGREAAQNILALRFANGLFEPIWNRESSRLSLSFYGKRPGPGMRLDKVSMKFSLVEVEHSDDSPDFWGGGGDPQADRSARLATPLRAPLAQGDPRLSARVSRALGRVIAYG